MEERESSTSHTYLPGTASLVQEIDSELGARVTVQCVYIELTSPCFGRPC